MSSCVLHVEARAEPSKIETYVKAKFLMIGLSDFFCLSAFPMTRMFMIKCSVTMFVPNQKCAE